MYLRGEKRYWYAVFMKVVALQKVYTISKNEQVIFWLMKMVEVGHDMYHPGLSRPERSSAQISISANIEIYPSI